MSALRKGLLPWGRAGWNRLCWWIVNEFVIHKNGKEFPLRISPGANKLQQRARREEGERRGGGGGGGAGHTNQGTSVVSCFLLLRVHTSLRNFCAQMVQLAGTKALVRDAWARKLALGKLVLTFSLLFPLNSFGLEFTLTPPPTPLRQCVAFVCQLKKPSSVYSDVLLAEAVLGLVNCPGFSDRWGVKC